MKKIFLLPSLFLSICSFGQKVGVYPIDVKGEYTKTRLADYDVWLQTDLFYIKNFELTPVGLMHSVTEMEKILSDNKISFDKTLTDKSLISSSLEGIKDYEKLDVSIKNGNSEVSKAWLIGGAIVSLKLNKEGYNIIVQRKK